MRNAFFCTVMLSGLLLLGPGGADAFSKKEATECSKCHTLNKDQAGGLLSGLIPNLKIIHVKPSPLKGLWEVGVDSGGRKGILYLDYSLKYLISPMTGGNLFDIKAKANITEQSFRKINKVERSQIPLGDALVMGDRNAKHKVIVFDDPD